MNKKFFLIASIIVLTVSIFHKTSNAQDNKFKINNLSIEARADFVFSAHDSITNSGFNGKLLNFVLKGQITDKFSYSFRQRLNKILPASDDFNSFYNLFGNTDFINLTYHTTENLSFTAGKMTLAVGGWDYDLAPIDIYFGSASWNDYSCYQFGIASSYETSDKKNVFTFQFTNSPYILNPNEGLYAYNLMWSGNFKHIKTTYSFNMFEFRKGKYVNFIATGTKFIFGGFTGYIDFTNRALFEQEQFFFKDMSLIAKADYTFNERLSLFVKGGYEVNDFPVIENPLYEIFDPSILPGYECAFYGLGAEFYPLRGKNDIRLHCFFAVNQTPDMLTYQANAGITWRIKFKK